LNTGFGLSTSRKTAAWVDVRVVCDVPQFVGAIGRHEPQVGAAGTFLVGLGARLEMAAGRRIVIIATLISSIKASNVSSSVLIVLTPVSAARL
jgi:hypothetical protein